MPIAQRAARIPTMPKKPRALRIFFGAMSATDTMAISRRIPTRSIGPVTFDFFLRFGRPGLGRLLTRCAPEKMRRLIYVQSLPPLLVLPHNGGGVLPLSKTV